MSKIPYNPTFIKLSSIKLNTAKLNKEEEDYDWAGLQKSISVNGMLEPLKVEELDDIYYVIDGQHRITVLIEMYSKDHEVPVIILNRSEKFRLSLDE